MAEYIEGFPSAFHAGAADVPKILQAFISKCNSRIFATMAFTLALLTSEFVYATTEFDKLPPAESFVTYEVYHHDGKLSWRIEVYPDGRALLTGVHPSGARAGDREKGFVEIFKDRSDAKSLYEAVIHRSFSQLPSEVDGPASANLTPFSGRFVVATPGLVKRTAIKGYAKRPGLDRVFSALERYVGIYPYRCVHKEAQGRTIDTISGGIALCAGPMIRYVSPRGYGLSDGSFESRRRDPSFEIAVYEDGYAIYIGPNEGGPLRYPIRDGGIQRLRREIILSGIVLDRESHICGICEQHDRIEVSVDTVGSNLQVFNVGNGFVSSAILRALLALHSEADVDEFRCAGEKGPVTTCAREKEHLKEAYRNALGRSK